MDEYEKQEIVEDFVTSMISDVDNVKLLMQFLNFDEKTRNVVNDCIETLDGKLERIQHVSTLDEAKKYLKVKKIIKANENRYKRVK